MQRRQSPTSTLCLCLFLLSATTAAAFFTPSSTSSALQTLPTLPTHTNTHTHTRTRPLQGSINELYPSEEPDPNRRVLKLTFLAATRDKKPPKSDKEKKLDAAVWGRWKLVENSIDRPSQADLKQYGSKLKPTHSTFEEDLLFDIHGALMLTKEDTCAYGMGWMWMNLRDVYEAPTLRFRINRKGEETGVVSFVLVCVCGCVNV